MESGITKNQIFEQLARSTHRDLSQYVPATRAAARLDPGFLAHLISWNRGKGQVRDSKVALPIISLSCSEFKDPELVDNSMAHVLVLRPREMARAVRFTKEVRIPGWGRALRRNVGRFLENLEADRKKFDRVALQHRESLKTLYSFPYTGGSLKPGPVANVLLNKRNVDKSLAEYHAGSLRGRVALLKDMTPLEAAGTIVGYKIPFLVASGAMGARIKEPEVLMALIERMTSAELGVNMTFLERAGVKKNPVLRAALENALKRAGSSATGSTLRMTKHIEAVEDEDLKEKLISVQEKKLDAQGIEGNWLVIGDQSGSMSRSVELAKQLAAVLARLVKGRVHLVFVNNGPTYYDVSGKTLEEVTNMTRHVVAGGGTCLGAGLQYLVERKLDVDGVAIVSDGGENAVPFYHQAHAAFKKLFDKDLPTYLYHLPGDPDMLSANCQAYEVSLQAFDASKLDFYSIPNIAQTMRTNRYSLVDEVMDCPLLTVDRVLGMAKEAVTV